MTDLVQARWVAGYPIDLPGQGTIEPGGLATIPKGEAQASAHWEPVDLDDLKKDELVDLAEEAGIDPKAKTKAELASAITKRPATDEEHA